MARKRLALVLVALVGCSGPPAAPPEAPPVATATAPAATLVPVEDAGAPDAAAAVAAPPQQEPLHFPPGGFAAPFARTAKPGDGLWASFVEGAAGASPILVRSMVHPHPIKG